MQTLPEALRGHVYYEPTEQGREGRFKARLAEIKRWQQQHRD
ncbi:hypothetical protein [Levilactobacillus brevis]